MLFAQNKNNLYRFFIAIISVGYLWLFYSWNKTEQEGKIGCLFKKITSYPCPSCGTTRATILGFKGEWLQSLLINPFGIIVIVIMTIVPIWIGVDWIFKKETFYSFYKKANFHFKKIYSLIIIAFSDS